MPVDLHIHTNISDGTDPPAKVAELAADGALTAIAITDHDAIDGILPAQLKGEELGLMVVPGIEFTTENPQAEIHILGYFFDIHDPDLLEVLNKVQQERVARIYKITEKLSALGVKLDPAEVLASAGKKSPGRPHVARLLIKKGIVPNFKEAFNRYLDFRAPAYVPHFKLSPAGAISLISRSGGIPVLAHPAVSQCDQFIPQLAAEGLRGIEAYYPGYSPAAVEKYLLLAREHGLLVTGGSDFHGSDSGREMKLGEFTAPHEVIEELIDEH
jgi:hypothetical protein